MRRTGVGYLKSCANCVSKHVVRKAHKANKEPPPALLHTVPTMALDAMINLIQSHRDKVFDFDAFVDLPEGHFLAGDHLYTRSNKLRDQIAEVTLFHWNQKKSTRGGKSTVVTYHCAQLEGEQTRRTLIDDPKRRRSRKEKITRYHCGGWLKITIIDDNDRLVRIRITHAETHPPFPEGAGRRVIEIEEPVDIRGSVMMEVHDLGPAPVQMAPSPSTTSPSGDDDFAPASEYWQQTQDDHHIHLPPEPEMESYQEPRHVYYSPDQLSALHRNFNAILDMASRGVPIELDGAFQYVFKGINQVADEVRQSEIGNISGRSMR
ncbi:hypothetical protein HWV62_26678 [Athelia sp. TMB]|nr:hypothetical protein HWV62_26678 [Athelia sp. TMB]